MRWPRWRSLTSTTEQTKPEVSSPPASQPQPAPAPIQSSTPAPSPPVPSVAPEVSEKEKQKGKEERVKQARALVDKMAEQISKRENIPINMVRMELYLENRIRKTILPKIDRLDSQMKDLSHGVGAIGQLLLRNGNQGTSGEGTGSPPSTPEPSVDTIASTVEVPALPPPYDETEEYRAVFAAHQSDPLFGAMLLYVMGDA